MKKPGNAGLFHACAISSLLSLLRYPIHRDAFRRAEGEEKPIVSDATSTRVAMA
ncbi:MAG: hypothetical protein Q8J78_12635 [Moraxellaceae bacterium]|nr:hypothetical protein [Moraxellaceae bacterium]